MYELESICNNLDLRITSQTHLNYILPSVVREREL